MEKIISRSNEKIKAAALLAASAKTRRETGLFLLEGARLCADAAMSGARIMQAFLTAQAMEKYATYTQSVIENTCACYEITPEVGSKLTDTLSTQGVFCVCSMLDSVQSANKIDPNGRYAALENIQDPANLGAICRTAEALGVSGLIINGGCDIYNPKALRAAMGASLRMHIIETENLPELLMSAARQGVLTIAAIVSGEGARGTEILKTPGGVICVIGNEGAGVTQSVLDACAERVAIPMKGTAESLNASACAAILMWELMG